MRIFWSPQARDDLLEVVRYLSDKNPYAAKSLYERIEAIAEALTAAPYLGRPGRVPGTRELVVTNTPYILPYQVRQERIEILRVYHSARKWPRKFG